MNFVRQKLITLQNRSRGLQTMLRRWAMYNDSVSHELKGDLLARFTPVERDQFDGDLELTRTRLRPVSTHIRTMSTWFDFVLEQVHEQLDRARTLLDQGRHQECLGILNDVETRMLTPNAETLAYAFRTFSQHAGCEFHQKLAAIDAIVRELYLPTVKLVHSRGKTSKEILSRTPVAYLTERQDAYAPWRQHAIQAANVGRRIPISLLGVPREGTLAPWNIVAVAHEVGMYLYQDLDLCWEIPTKFQNEAIHAGISPQTTSVWGRWHEVLFGDVFATLRLGPAYVSGMIELLGAEVGSAGAWRTDTVVPPVYLRWHVMLQTLQLLNFTDHARERFNQVHMLCGDPHQVAERMGPSWLQLLNECRQIAGLMAFSPCQRLGGARVVDVVPAFLATEMQNALKVRDLLLAGDESCAQDEHFGWAESVRDVSIPVALAGLRFAFDNTNDFETSRRLRVRFWCLMQYLAGNTEQARQREDQEFAPGEAQLRSIAKQAAPAVPAMTPAMA